MPTYSPLLKIKNVSKIFGDISITKKKELDLSLDKEAMLSKNGCTIGLQNVSLEINQGECFVIMGLSGSGKSTLIRLLNRLIEPTSGSIELQGTDILSLSQSELRLFRREKMAMVFQHFALFPHMTVIENIAFGLKVRGLERERYEEKSREWIKHVELEGYEHHLPSELSGGQKQRVGLARALAADTDILLMDEAFSALDPLLRREMQNLLLDLQSRLKKTIIFITHDLEEAIRLGDRMAILRDGRLVQTGTPADILLRPKDNFVARFAQDVNRNRLLTVGDVMDQDRRTPPTHHENDEVDTAPRININTSLESALIHFLKIDGMSLVENEQSEVVGVVTQEDILRVMEVR